MSRYRFCGRLGRVSGGVRGALVKESRGEPRRRLNGTPLNPRPTPPIQWVCAEVGVWGARQGGGRGRPEAQRWPRQLVIIVGRAQFKRVPCTLPSSSSRCAAPVVKRSALPSPPTHTPLPDRHHRPLRRSAYCRRPLHQRLFFK